MHGTMPQDLLKRFKVLKEMQKKNFLFSVPNAFYKSVKAKYPRAIRFHSCETILFIIFIFIFSSSYPLMFFLRAKIALNAVICMILSIFSFIMEL